MRRTVYIVAAVFMLTLPSSVGRSQSTDRSEMDQWLRASEYQGDLPIGTKITMSNWQHKQFMPLGLICPGSCWLSRAALWLLLWRVWSGSRRPIVSLPGRRLNRGQASDRDLVVAVGGGMVEALRELNSRYGRMPTALVMRFQ